jgi:1-deoxy-D-xylulose-5-phosphate reductoisomerase
LLPEYLFSLSSGFSKSFSNGKNMKNLAILGCTGSIGTQTLDIVRRYPQKFRVVAVTANSNLTLLKDIAEEFKPRFIGICDEKNAGNFSVSYGARIEYGAKTTEEAASIDDVDEVVCAIVGMAGLKGVFAAVKAGKTVALANKESLVCAGSLLTDYAKRNNVAILPVDSEHCAVWQCLNAGKKSDLDSIILTASGGPFVGFTDEKQFDDVSVEQAIAHPNWKMGRKISVDSATMMNKGLEIIEARWLFDCEKIDYFIHPQSIIHSMVKFKDGAIIAQLSNPTMELPIQLALTYPDRLNTVTPDFDFSKNLTFVKPNEKLFYLPALAKDSLCKGKNASCVLNAANEAAVALFLDRKISFGEIQRLVAKIYSTAEYYDLNSIDEVYSTFDEIVKKTNEDYAKILGK